MIKISIDARMINHSGIGTYIRNLVPNLANKYNLILLGDREILENFDWKEKVKVINCKSKIYSINEQFELPYKIPVCDIFISPHYNVPVLPVKAGKRIVIIHDVYHLAFSRKLTLPQRLYSRILINFAVKHSDTIITVSKFSKSEIIRYAEINEAKVRTIYLGFNTATKSMNKDVQELTRKKYNLPQKFIFFVGNIKPHKNLKNLLLAFDILIKKKINHKLVITGSREGFITSDKEIDGFLEKNKAVAENVIFTGYVDHKDLTNIYKLADVFVFPSLYEGFGIPPIEAMIAGIPVIASREASLPEICGDAALYCDAFRPVDIAEKIEMVLTDEVLKNQLIQKGTTNLVRFTEEKFEQGWQSIIEKKPNE